MAATSLLRGLLPFLLLRAAATRLDTQDQPLTTRDSTSDPHAPITPIHMLRAEGEGEGEAAKPPECPKDFKCKEDRPEDGGKSERFKLHGCWGLRNCGECNSHQPTCAWCMLNDPPAPNATKFEFKATEDVVKWRCQQRAPDYDPPGNRPPPNDPPPEPPSGTLVSLLAAADKKDEEPSMTCYTCDGKEVGTGWVPTGGSYSRETHPKGLQAHGYVEDRELANKLGNANGERIIGGPLWPSPDTDDGAGVYQCRNACESDKGCNYFVWLKDKGCRLYKKFDEPRPVSVLGTGSITWRRNEMRWEYQYLGHGVCLNKQGKPSAACKKADVPEAECKAICSRTPSCKAYEKYGGGRFCMLHLPTIDAPHGFSSCSNQENSNGYDVKTFSTEDKLGHCYKKLED